jgi:hypothetical protein
LDDAFRRSYARLEKRYASAADLAAAVGATSTSPPPLPAVRGRVQPPAPPQPPRAMGHAVRGCPQCRQPVEVEDQFCVHCGTQLVAEVKRCASCGSYPDATDEFCIFCGHDLTGAKAPVTSNE